MEKGLYFYVINANKVAREAGIGGRINTVMQTCFFSLSGVLPKDQAVTVIQESIRKTYGRKGPEIVRMNLDAVDRTLEHLHPVSVPTTLEEASSEIDVAPPVPDTAPDFVREVLGTAIARCGDSIPVSALAV